MMTNLEEKKYRRIRSFVRRDGRLTDAQQKALETLWPVFGLEVKNGLFDFNKIFKRDAKRVLEIGFGSGHSLLAAAMANPACDFIGVEIYKPGIGTLLSNIDEQKINSIRLYAEDVVDVLIHCIPDGSLDVVQIFFPDPWRKRRHHKRRLIQTPFIDLLVAKLKKQGEIHLATDWENYAFHMMEVLSSHASLENVAGDHCFTTRSVNRPIVTKFEQRGDAAGRKIWELRFIKCLFPPLQKED